jgi:hypothetical protein
MLGACGLGEASIGITAGSGIDGAGDTDRREEKDDRRLWLMTLGGFIGKATDVGVPGADGIGEPTAAADSTDSWALNPKSGGAGLLEEIRRGGRSLLLWLATFDGACLEASSWLAKVYWPSFVLREYMCTDRSDDCVAMYSFKGSQATP